MIDPYEWHTEVKNKTMAVHLADYFPEIIDFKNKSKIIEEKIQKGHPTMPSKIQDEIECNIFLKAVSLDVFSKLRDLKDNF